MTEATLAQHPQKVNRFDTDFDFGGFFAHARLLSPLIKKFGFDPDAHHAHIDRIFARFQNPFLEDETARVAREPIRKLAPTDRLIKPFMTAYSYNLPVNHLVFGAAAALHFDCPEDEQSVEMIQKIRTEGLEKALEAYSQRT